MGGTILATCFVLTFGWTGSPDEWVARAWAAKLFHAARDPYDARWNGARPFHSHVLRDDQVPAEPDMGTRVQQCTQAAEEGLRSMLGQDASNQVRDEEEGELEMRKVCWGHPVMLWHSKRQPLTTLSTHDSDLGTAIPC